MPVARAMHLLTRGTSRPLRPALLRAGLLLLFVLALGWLGCRTWKDAQSLVALSRGGGGGAVAQVRSQAFAAWGGPAVGGASLAAMPRACAGGCDMD